MLQLIRSKAGSLFVKILFALLIISFGIWGIGDIFREHTAAETTVAKVGDIKIQADELQNAVRQKMEQIRGLFGGDLGPEQAKQLGIVENVLDSMVQRDLLTLEQRRLGIVVGDSVVRNDIMADPHFHNSTGAFDRNLFNNILAANRLSEDRYVALLRSDIARRELTTAVTSGATTPPVLADQLYRSRNEKRTVDTVLVATDAMTSVKPPTEGELSDYYAHHQDLFRAPEYRGFTALIVTPDEVAATITVPEDKLRAEYQSRLDEFTTPPRRQLQQMVLPDEAKAKEAEAQLAAGKPFAEVAKAVADQSGDTIELGWVKREEMLPALADAAFALKQGEVSQPVQSPLGWHIFKVTGADNGATKPFEEVRKQVASDAAHEMASDKLFELSNQIEDSLAGGATVEQVAEQFKLKLTKVAAVDPDGKDPQGKEVDIPAAGEVLRSAFETGQGQTTRLNEMKQDGYFVLRVDKITPSTVRPLAEVKDHATALWLDEKRKAAAEAEAKEIEAGLKQGQSLATLAAAKQLKPETVANVTRNGAESGLPGALISRIFEIKKGETALAAGPKGWYVAQLKDIAIPDPAADKDAVAKVADGLTNDIRGDLLAEFEKSLRNRFPVEIQQDQVDKIL